MTAKLKIVHESETQRQHVRIRLEAQARIGERLYKLRDLSSGGFSVDGEVPLGAEWSGPARLIFPFGKYALWLECDARAVDNGKAGGAARFRFMDLDQGQVSLLNAILNAALSGTVLSGAGLLHVVSRDNFTAPRRPPAAQAKGMAAAARRVLPAVFTTLAGMAGLLFIMGNVYEDAVILKFYNGVVEAGEISVRMRAPGVVRMLVSPDAERVSSGQPLAVVSTVAAPPAFPVAGSEEAVKSPCDCRVLSVHLNDGEFGAMGDRLFTLVPLDSRPWISVLVPPEKAHHLQLQDDVNVSVAGEGGFLRGRVAGITAAYAEKPYSRVEVRTEESIPLEMLGRPAYVEFMTY